MHIAVGQCPKCRKDRDFGFGSDDDPKNMWCDECRDKQNEARRQREALKKAELQWHEQKHQEDKKTIAKQRRALSLKDETIEEWKSKVRTDAKCPPPPGIARL